MMQSLPQNEDTGPRSQKLFRISGMATAENEIQRGALCGRTESGTQDAALPASVHPAASALPMGA